MYSDNIIFRVSDY